MSAPQCPYHLEPTLCIHPVSQLSNKQTVTLPALFGFVIAQVYYTVIVLPIITLLLYRIMLQKTDIYLFFLLI